MGYTSVNAVTQPGKTLLHALPQEGGGGRGRAALLQGLKVGESTLSI